MQRLAGRLRHAASFSVAHEPISQVCRNTVNYMLMSLENQKKMLINPICKSQLYNYTISNIWKYITIFVSELLYENFEIQVDTEGNVQWRVHRKNSKNNNFFSPAAGLSCPKKSDIQKIFQGYTLFPYSNATRRTNPFVKKLGPPSQKLYSALIEEMF